MSNNGRACLQCQHVQPTWVWAEGGPTRAASNQFPHPVTGEKVFVMMDACHMLKLARNMLQVNDDRCRPFCTIYASATKSYLNILVRPFALLWLDVMIIILLFVLVWGVTDSNSAGTQSNCEDHRKDPLEVSIVAMIASVTVKFTVHNEGSLLLSV